MAVFTALSQSGIETLSKKTLKDFDSEVIGFSIFIFALPFLLVVLSISGIPSIGESFVYAVIASGLLNVVAILLFTKSLQLSALSLSVPMLAFTPVFLLITSPLIVGEFPSEFGLYGIFMIVGGAYLLNLDTQKFNLLSPFVSIIKEKGIFWMLCVAGIWSISANFDKIGVQNSSPIFYATTVFAFVTLILTIILIIKSKNNLIIIQKNFKKLFPLGVFGSLVAIFQTNSYDLEIVPYVIAIKRTSILFSSFIGFVIFKEPKVKQRLIAIGIMIIGVFLIFMN